MRLWMTLTNKDYHFVFFYLVSFLFLFIWQVLMVRKTDTILMVNLVNWKRSTIAVMILILILMTILATTLPFTWSTADGKKSPKSRTQFPHLSDFSTLFIPSLCFASLGKLFWHSSQCQCQSNVSWKKNNSKRKYITNPFVSFQYTYLMWLFFCFLEQVENLEWIKASSTSSSSPI